MNRREVSVLVVGMGNMGSALARALAEAGWKVGGAEKDPQRAARVREELKDLGVKVFSPGDQWSVQDWRVMIVAVKPKDVPETLGEFSMHLAPSTLVISIAAGVRIETLKKLLPHEQPLVRVMPNTPAMVGAGASALAAAPWTRQEDVELARELMGAVGIVEVVDEALMDGVTALSGSGPAYAAAIIEALADGGVAEGLPRAIAQRLAAQTLLGAARMVLEGIHPAQLKDMVTSPGGTTIAGLEALETGGLRGALMRAVRAAAARSRALAQSTKR